ncbi:NAD(P)/FAD-dependent oxidoreductase [Desulforamulus aeronauticus]|uniref:NADH dehydrogenase n=1 Tax=Desulforamulus aeronauticus DSM 10349 TaxID=1121421 RepID=A0A1M6S6B5_9FIRM|nr:NAD(P)/FAD-dependent oxidoreductase [Desulforamulus aeronauticus]SHK40283.1 NADH dehydrogenase [Desulforamulus aeronauticus DSM 10349]
MVTTTDIVVLGAGYGGIRAAQQLSKYLTGRQDIRIVLINRQSYHTLMTQLYEPAVGTKQCKDIIVPLQEFLSEEKVSFIEGTVTAIDIAKRQIFLEGEAAPISFAYLVVALGSRTEYFGIEGLQEYSRSLNDIQSAKGIFKRVQDILSDGTSTPTFVIGGGGLTGVEFAGELADYLKRARGEQGAKSKVLLIESANQLLPGMSEGTCRYAKRTLEKLGVEVLTGVLVKKVTDDAVYLSSGKIIPYSLLMWAGGISGNSVLKDSGLQTDPRGRLLVNQFLQYVGEPRVYGVGDSALVKDPATDRPILPTAQAALQHGAAAAYNIYAEITGLPKRIYQPSFILLCITIGKKQGFGESESFKIKGAPAACIKKLIPHKYFYTLGGFKLLRKRLLK